MKHKYSARAWMVLLGVILIRGFAGGGINLTSGQFLAPVSEDIGVGIGSLSVYFSITSIALVAWLPIAGKLVNKYDVRILAIIAAVLQALSFAAFAFLNNVMGWYILAVPQAMGAAILVNLLGPILINRWFPQSTGFLIGIQMAFVSLFGAIIQPWTSDLIATRGWRTAYFVIGVITFIVVLISSIIFLHNRPDNATSKNTSQAKAKGETLRKTQEETLGGTQEETLGVTQEETLGGTQKETLGTTQEQTQEKTQAQQKLSEGIQISEKTAIRSISFGMLLIFMIAMTGVAVFSQHIPTYGGLIGYNMAQIGTALSLTSLGSAAGAVAIGYICDKIGGLKTCYGIIVIWIISVIGLLISPKGFWLFAGSSFLHGFAASSIFVLAPILTLIFYGKMDYEKIFAKISMGAPLASILLIPAYGYIYDATCSYYLVLLSLILLLIIAATCIAVGWKKRCTKEGCATWRK